MTPLAPIQGRRIKGVPCTKYPLPEVSSHPCSTERADDLHYIFPIGNDSYFVLIENEDGSGTILPHVVGLTRKEHRKLEEHESWIKLEDGEFVWYDRVPPTDPYDEIPEDWQQWVRIGALDPQPGVTGRRSKKPRLSLDFDGTLVAETWPEIGDWLPGAEKALKTLSKHYEIVIFTLRVAPVLQDEKTVHKDAAKQMEAIKAKLASIGLGDIEVWQRPYKPPCVAFVDDRNVEFSGNWPKVVRKLTGRLA